MRLERAALCVMVIACGGPAPSITPTKAKAKTLEIDSSPPSPEAIEFAIASTRIASLEAAGQSSEADALRRHLVCPTTYHETPAPLPQDHDQPFWDRWEIAHPIPLDLAKTQQPVEETHYVSLYDHCARGPSDPALAEQAAETWVEIARSHRTRDTHGGPYVVLRAIEAYQTAEAIGVPKGPAMRHARLGLGEALHAQQRYRAASAEMVRALLLCDETRACAPDERRNALALLADSLVTGDFDGSPADAPVIARPDILDVEPMIDRAAQKLRVGIDRAVDPAIVPKDSAFAADVIAAVAQVFSDLAMYDNTIAAFEELRKRFPMHREMPRVVQAIARTRARSARLVRAALAAPVWVKATATWDELESLVKPGSPWREANNADASALALADQAWSDGASERGEALLRVVMALAAAATAGVRPMPLDPVAAPVFIHRAHDAWTAQSTVGRAALADLELAELEYVTDTGGTIVPARWSDAASVMRATQADNLADGALKAVQLADLHVHYEEKRWTASQGQEGLRPRERTLHAPLRARAKEALPGAIAEAVAARDVFARVVTDYRVSHVRREAAALLFSYGHGEEAGTRLADDVAATCKTPDGFAAFSLAVDVARASKNTVELKRLGALHADPATTCAKTPEQVVRGRVSL